MPRCGKGLLWKMRLEGALENSPQCIVFQQSLGRIRNERLGEQNHAVPRILKE